MKIDLYIRSKTSQYLRDLIIKDKCEVCNKDSDLELHHIKAFAVIMNECFESLGYDRHEDTESYTDTQLINIANWMLGAQLQSTYSTLCQTCHTDWHSERGGFYKTTNKFDEYYKRKEAEDKLKEIDRCKNVIKPYLKSILGKKLYREEQVQLANTIEFKVDGKKQKSYRKLNYALHEKFKLPYIITPKRTNSTRYWIIEKIDE